MKKTYKAAMDQITVSDALRQRVLAAAAKQASLPQSSNTWRRFALGAATCLVVAAAGGAWMSLGGVGNTGGSSAPYFLTAECTTEDAGGAADADAEEENGMAGGAANDSAAPQSAAPASSEPAAPENGGKKADNPSETAAAQTERQLYAGRTVAYSTLAEAQAALAFAAEVPAFVAERASSCSVIGGEVLQISWMEESRSFTCFVAESVFEPAYPLEEASYLDQEELAAFYGNDEGIHLIVMENDGQTISLLSDEGMDAEEATVMAEACLLLAGD